jgi:hypothetical protein
MGAAAGQQWTPLAPITCIRAWRAVPVTINVPRDRRLPAVTRLPARGAGVGLIAPLEAERALTAGCSQSLAFHISSPSPPR